MSLSVSMSAERKRFRLGYLADAALPHLKFRGLPQLKTASSDGLVAASLMAVKFTSLGKDPRQGLFESPVTHSSFFSRLVAEADSYVSESQRRGTPHLKSD